MDDLEWSWLARPEWALGLGLGAFALGLALASPIRTLFGRDLTMIACGMVVGLVGWVVGDRGIGLAGTGFMMTLVGAWLFVGDPGTLHGLAGGLPADEPAAFTEDDERIAEYDIDDPDTAAGNTDVAADAVPWSDVVRGFVDDSESVARGPDPG